MPDTPQVNRAAPGAPESGRLPASLSSVAARMLVVLLSLGALSLWLLDPPFLKNLRLAQFDQFQRWHPRPAST